MRSQQNGRSRQEPSVSVSQSQVRVKRLARTDSLTPIRQAPDHTNSQHCRDKVTTEGTKGQSEVVPSKDLTSEQKKRWLSNQWVTRARLPTEKKRSAAERAHNSKGTEEDPCTSFDTIGRAEIDVFTVRQTAERPQRGVAASGMFFSPQGCDSPKSRTELPVELFKRDRQKRGTRGERYNRRTLVRHRRWEERRGLKEGT